MRPISLHQIVAPEISPTGLVGIAGDLDCQHVCLFTQGPPGGWKFPTVGDDDMPELSTAMADRGISAYGVTSFPLHPDTDVAVYEAGLARGGRLGAQYASVRVLDPDDARVVDAFARLGEIAALHGLIPSIEFTGYNAPDVLPRALRIIESAGVGTLTIDPLHIVRSGASFDLLRSLDRSRFGYVQLCDGPLKAPEGQYGHESAAERQSPGDGEFPLDEILALAPDGRAVSLETPSERLAAEGVGAAIRAGLAVEATRRLLRRLEPD